MCVQGKPQYQTLQTARPTGILIANGICLPPANCLAVFRAVSLATDRSARIPYGPHGSPTYHGTKDFSDETAPFRQLHHHLQAVGQTPFANQRVHHREATRSAKHNREGNRDEHASSPSGHGYVPRPRFPSVRKCCAGTIPQYQYNSQREHIGREKSPIRFQTTTDADR